MFEHRISPYNHYSGFFLETSNETSKWLRLRSSGFLLLTSLVKMSDEPQKLILMPIIMRDMTPLLLGYFRRLSIPSCFLVSGGSIGETDCSHPLDSSWDICNFISRLMMILWRTVTSGIFNTLIQCSGFHVRQWKTPKIHSS